MAAPPALMTMPPAAIAPRISTRRRWAAAAQCLQTPPVSVDASFFSHLEHRVCRSVFGQVVFRIVRWCRFLGLLGGKGVQEIGTTPFFLLLLFLFHSQAFAAVPRGRLFWKSRIPRRLSHASRPPSAAPVPSCPLQHSGRTSSARSRGSWMAL